MKIVAIDFETANRSSASACSLGLSIYDEGVFVDSYAFLICPPINHRDFSFTYIHHLTYDDVKDAKEFPEHYDELKAVFKDALLIAHNARFDINVLNSMCDYYGLDRFNNYYLDTVSLARKYYPKLENHRLNTIADYLGIELNHHEAQSDADACLMILINVMQDTNCFDINQLINDLHLKIFINK